MRKRRIVGFSLLAAAVALGGTLLAGNLSSGQAASAGAAPDRVMDYVHIDIEGVADASELAAEADLVVIATVGPASLTGRSSDDGRFTDYLHVAKVQRTLKGAPVDEVKVVRSGLAAAFASRTVLVDNLPAGAIRPGRYVLFLQASADAGVYQIVGHTQGVFGFEDGHLQPQGTGAFMQMRGQDEADLVALLAAAPAGDGHSHQH